MTDIRAFENLADDYDAYRPDYPPELMKRLRDFVETNDISGRHIIDVGAGTGISTREMAAAFGHRYFVTGMEPCLPMLRKAVLHPKTHDTIAYVVAAAENLPAGDASARLITTAQAVQWFDRPTFYREAARVLLPGGVLAIMQNNRDWRKSPFLDAYEKFLETYGEGYTRYYRSFDIAGELSGVEGLAAAEPVGTSWTRSMIVDEFIGLAFSSSKMKSIVRKYGKDWTAREIRELASQYNRAGEKLSIVFRSELFMARRRRQPAPANGTGSGYSPR